MCQQHNSNYMFVYFPEVSILNTNWYGRSLIAVDFLDGKELAG